MNCRCAFCDVTFDSDVDEDECPRCKALYEAALKQTQNMALPEFRWKWSKSEMQERLGVNGRVDE